MLDSPDHPIDGALRIERPSARQAYSIIVSPLPATAYARGPSMAAALVMIDDPAAELRSSAMALATLFDPTPAQARVAREIAAGRTVAEIAAGTGVSPGTVRNQLKEVFARTGVNRQAALARLVLSIVIVGVGDGD